MTARQDARADSRVRFHEPHLLGLELAGLVEDGVAHGDLADVVEPRGGEEELHLGLGPAQRVRDGRGVVPDPPGVLAGVVVAVLGGYREAGDDLELRLLEFARALTHRRLGLLADVLDDLGVSAVRLRLVAGALEAELHRELAGLPFALLVEDGLLGLVKGPVVPEGRADVAELLVGSGKQLVRFMDERAAGVRCAR